MWFGDHTNNMTLTFQDRLVRLAETEINTERIRNIEKAFGNDNTNPLAVSGRALVGEGALLKECRKKAKTRYFFLFNDILVYGTAVINKKKYINQHIINLDKVQIRSIGDSDNPKLRNGWLIMSPKKSFCVYASTPREKIEWMTHISNCIEKLSNNLRKGYDSVNNSDVAPMWIPDKGAEKCMRCKNNKFTMVNRRHHCRNCGYVVCGDCSKNKYLLPSQSDEPVRVCNTCFETLSKTTTTNTTTNISPENKDAANTNTNSDTSDESGIDDEPSSFKENNAQFYSL